MSIAGLLAMSVRAGDLRKRRKPAARESERVPTEDHEPGDAWRDLGYERPAAR